MLNYQKVILELYKVMASLWLSGCLLSVHQRSLFDKEIWPLRVGDNVNVLHDLESPAITTLLDSWEQKPIFSRVSERWHLLDVFVVCIYIIICVHSIVIFLYSCYMNSYKLNSIYIYIYVYVYIYIHPLVTQHSYGNITKLNG